LLLRAEAIDLRLAGLEVKIELRRLRLLLFQSRLRQAQTFGQVGDLANRAAPVLRLFSDGIYLV
jgi:hypothetical protein